MQFNNLSPEFHITIILPFVYPIDSCRNHKLCEIVAEVCYIIKLIRLVWNAES